MRNRLYSKKNILSRVKVGLYSYLTIVVDLDNSPLPETLSHKKSCTLCKSATFGAKV